MKTFLFWAVIAVLAFIGIYNCAIEMAEGNWPTNAMLAALLIFASGILLGMFLSADRRPEPKRCRLVAVRDRGNLAAAASWDAEIWCPVCGAQHVDKDEWATKLHKAHKCDQCGLIWVPFPVPTYGVES